MKKFLILAAILAATGAVSAQTSVEHSQSRVIEPRADVFMIPLTAEIVPTTDRREFTYVFNIRQDYGVSSLSQVSITVLLEELKKRALYMACKETDSDLIVAATFNIKGSDNTRDNLITVEMRGYPAVYRNWKTMDLSTERGYGWIPEVYPTIFRARPDENTAAVESSK
jgi:hypothetical protein